MSQDPQPARNEYHQPVMAEEVVEVFRPIKQGVVVDATFGGGGHTRRILDAIPEVTVVGFDRDPATVSNAIDLGPRLTLVTDDFRHLGEVLDQRGIGRIAGALFDLGVSSRHLDDPDRGSRTGNADRST